jgi:hypothetical protein
MPRAEEQVQPRTFFLNEKHELASIERGGGGALPKFQGIRWAAKGRQISSGLTAAARAIATSNDPLKGKRLFLLAQPVGAITKRREDREGHPKGTYQEQPDFGGPQGKAFDRLGLDLLQVTDDGQAVVHAEKGRIDQLTQRTETLADLGPLEQSRWAYIDSFSTVPLELRVDADWVRAMRAGVPSDVVIELQPVLTRVEADQVLRAIADLLAQRHGEALRGTGTDFSGRHWFRGKAGRESVWNIAKDYYSVQAIHSPLYSVAAAKTRGRQVVERIEVIDSAVPQDAVSLPCVAVVDLGIPRGHRRLAPYMRGQFYPQDAPSAPVGDHGAFVASRVVFGDHVTHNGLVGASGRCSIYDAMVADYPSGPARMDRVNDKIVLAAMQGVRGAAPDVRVFNLSFGDTRHLADFNEIEKREKRLALQDLDNFIFASDAVVVVAAGNSRRGVIPDPPYPRHYQDERWGLGPWACGFNTLVCGSFVSQLSASGLVGTVGWPSPFTRIGPGLCESPVPSFSAPGGNFDRTYNPATGMGVWGFSGQGLPEDRVGTSHAAPILAREAALALSELARFCLPGTQPFAVTARAFLTLTAKRPVADENVRELATRTLGDGRASVQRLVTPSGGSAVMVWQGLIESPRDTLRVQLPIPLAWLQHASEPVLRLVVCADPPVNEAARATWACRRIVPVLHAHPDSRGVTAPRGRHPSFPVVDRVYKLDRYRPGADTPAEGDLWLIEIRYEEIAPYPPGMDFDPRQRVAFAAELIDKGDRPVDPQAAMQRLPIAESMTRLSIQPTAVRSPVILRVR